MLATGILTGHSPTSQHIGVINGQICSWLVAWHIGRTLVFDRRTYSLDLQLTGDHYVGRPKPSAVGQPTRPTHPFILSG